MAERRVKSNDTIDKLQLYTGIGVVGVATGAAIAVSRDPIYDRERKIRGKDPVQRKAQWDPNLTQSILRMDDPLQAEVYDMYRNQGNVKAAFDMEQDARRSFHNRPYEQQLNIIESLNETADDAIPRGTFAQRMFSRARAAARRL